MARLLKIITSYCSIIILICSMFISTSELFAGSISGDELSNARLSSLEKRIQQYSTEHHALPQKLSDLPTRPDFDDSLVDGWDKPIIYMPQNDGSVILTSLGKDERSTKSSIQFSMVSEDERLNEEFWTFDHMEYYECFIRKYAQEHACLPKAISDISQDERNEYGLDGWGKPIEYKATTTGTVILTSRGKTGKSIFSKEFIVLVAKPQTRQSTTAPAK